MLLSLLKTKIHRAAVTRSELNHEGSIAIKGLIAAFASMSEQEADAFQCTLVYVDGKNGITQYPSQHPQAGGLT